jgi:hypothetical protein
MNFGFTDKNVSFLVYNNRPANHYTTNEMLHLSGYKLPNMKAIDLDGGLFISKIKRNQSAVYSSLTRFMNKKFFEIYCKKPTKSKYKDKAIQQDGVKNYNYSNVYPAEMIIHIHEFMELNPMENWVNGNNINCKS